MQPRRFRAYVFSVVLRQHYYHATQRGVHDVSCCVLVLPGSSLAEVTSCTAGEGSALTHPFVHSSDMLWFSFTLATPFNLFRSRFVYKSSTLGVLVRGHLRWAKDPLQAVEVGMFSTWGPQKRKLTLCGRSLFRCFVTTEHTSSLFTYLSRMWSGSSSGKFVCGPELRLFLLLKPLRSVCESPERAVLALFHSLLAQGFRRLCHTGD